MGRYTIRGRVDDCPDAYIANTSSAVKALDLVKAASPNSGMFVHDRRDRRDVPLIELEQVAERERRSKLPFGAVAFGIVGFAVGFLVTGFLLIGAVYLLGQAFGRQLVPRGLGFVTVPIAGGVGGFTLFSTLVTNREKRQRVHQQVASPLVFVGGQFKPGNFANRLCLVLAGLYAIAGHFIVSSITEEEISALYKYEFGKVLLYVWAPVAFLLVLPLIIAWARKPPSAK